MPNRFRLSFFSADKASTFVAARRSRKALAQFVTRGENVRSDKRIYIDIQTESAAEAIRQLVDGLNLHSTDVAIEGTPAIDPVEECLSCGNISDAPYVRCPNCDFIEIENCPHCHHPVARSEYVPHDAGYHVCPNCQTVVRLVFNDPLWDEQGHYNQPVVRVLPVGVPGGGGDV